MANSGQNPKLQQTKAQVQEVVDIMRQNVESVIDRDVKLSELDNRADNLRQGATMFENHAGHLKRKYWWKNMKMMIILILTGLVFLIILISAFKGKSEPSTSDNVPNTNDTNAPAVPNPASDTVAKTIVTRSVDRPTEITYSVAESVALQPTKGSDQVDLGMDQNGAVERSVAT